MSLKLKLIYQEHPYLFALILKAALSCINRGLNNMFFIGRHRVLTAQMDDNRITQCSLMLLQADRSHPASCQSPVEQEKHTLW